MTRVTRIQIAVLAVSQSMALSLLPSMALALTVAQSRATTPELAKLASYEEVIYGTAKSDKPTETRLAELEVKLFGKQSTGTLETRLSKISQALSYGSGGGGEGNKLLPPLPPALDYLPVKQAADRTSGSSGGSSAAGSGTYGDAYDTANADSSDTNDADALANATSLYSAGRVADAERAFRAIAEKNSRNADAFYNLGVIAEGRGDLRAALYDYRRAAAINPDDKELAQTVSSVETKVRQSSGGVLNPTVGTGTVGSAWAGTRNGTGTGTGTGAGAGAPGSVSPFQSGSPSAYSNANSQVSSQSQGSAPAPAPAPDKSALSAANTPKLKKMVADASNDYKRGNFDSAIAKLSQVAAVRGDDADVQYALAQAYRGKGEISQARQCMARASALNPNNPTYRSALSDLETALVNENGSLPALAPQRSASPSSAGMGGGLVSASPDGAIKPFSNSKAGDSFASGNSFASGVSRTASRRIERAISYGIAGAATGAISSAIWGSRYGGSRSSRIGMGALRGAAVGAALGLLFGR